jgi:integrase/recombinase XerD
MNKIERPKEQDRKPDPFSQEEIEGMREAANSLFDRMIIEVFYSSGVRISEARDLDWDNIDFQNKRVEVIDGKGGKDRVTLLSTKAVMLLKRYKETREDNNNWIFQSRYKNRMSRSSLYRHIKKMGKKADIGSEGHPVKPHRFRHSFASHLINSGVEQDKVQVLMGHSDPATTQIYAQNSQINIEHSYRKVFH